MDSSSHPRDHCRLLAFEPFDAGSHHAVREAISRHSQHEWTWITRPGRNWKWRVRLAAVEMVEVVRASVTARQAAGRGGPAPPGCDAIFATSLMSAADLRALLPVPLRDLPLILYMHENQAAYPESDQGREAASGVHGDRDVHFALTNLTSILAADRVIWNSQWNKQSFLEGTQTILRACSDVKIPALAERIEEKSAVVWPPVDVPVEWLEQRQCAKPEAAHGVLRNEGRPAKVVWPHRWEHDKGPDELLAIADRWSEELNLRWTILGERYGEVPPELIEFEKRIGPGGLDRIDHMGYVPDRNVYLEMVRECDWVLSTALHEFFGIAVAEALLAGCLPWLPERLSYPELLPDVARGLSPMNPPADVEAVREAIRSHVTPAIAGNAAARLDEEIAAAVAGCEMCESFRGGAAR